MVNIPACPASLELMMMEGGWPLISVPSGFTFPLKVLTLRTMLPAGAAAVPKAPEKIPVLPLKLSVSAVITVALDAGRVAAPPSSPELNEAF